MSDTPSNYFLLLGLEESFTIDEEALAENYRQLQAQNHPDNFVNGDESAKMRAVQLTSIINQAYQTLRNPVERAGYLLSLRGQNSQRVEQGDLPMTVLLEQMELRETLESLPEGEEALPEIDSMRAEMRARLSQCGNKFSEGLSTGELSQAKAVYHEMQFLHKLIKELDVSEERRLDY